MEKSEYNHSKSNLEEISEEEKENEDIITEMKGI